MLSESTLATQILSVFLFVCLKESGRLIFVGEQSQAAVTPEEEAMGDTFCTHCQHLYGHKDQKKALPFL